jgi:hypothetical protein
VELYIDSGDKARNKKIFHHLQEKLGPWHFQYGEGQTNTTAQREIQLRHAVEALTVVKTDFSGVTSITYERLENRRASRVAIYLPGAITDVEILENLRVLAKHTMIEFYNLLAPVMAELGFVYKG